MPKAIDLTAKRFGRLLVKGLHSRSDGVTRWNCLCDCGKTKIVRHANLGTNTFSCGCFRNTQNGLSRKHPLWKRWVTMLDRCNRPDHHQYRNYGGRGIKVCKRWISFPNFLEDMESSYRRGLTIDRIDVNGDYSPENCRWASPMQQSNNRRDNIRITFNGVTKTIQEWNRLCGFKKWTMYDRHIRSGWSAEKAITTPLRKKSPQKRA